MKRMPILLLFLLVALSIASVSTSPVYAQSSEWLMGWLYRKEHKIVGSTAGTVTDYQICIKAYYGSGTDSGENVYLNGKCRSDFGDIRFTASDGSTLLSYWVQEKVDGQYAVFWVKVPYIPAYPDTTTIYVYYGNPSAVATSSLANTFVRVIDRLVLALPFDEGSGSTVYDRSGYGNNGTLFNNPTWVDGRLGRALFYNSSLRSYVRVPRSSSIEPPNQISITAWIRPESIGAHQVVVNKRHTSSTYAWRSYALRILSDGRLRFGVSTDTGLTELTTQRAISFGRWHHVAATYDGSEMRIYVNGELWGQTSKTGTIQYDTPPLFIGTFEGHNEPYRGIIDEVRIYSRALSVAEIIDLYSCYPFEVPGNAEARGKTILCRYVVPEPAHGAWRMPYMSEYNGIILYTPEDASVTWSTYERWVIASFNLKQDGILRVNIKPAQIYVNDIPSASALWDGTFYSFYVSSGSIEIYWGSATVAEPPIGLFQYLYAGDFFGFVIVSWYLLMKQIFWVIPYFIIFIPLYIKTESAEYCAIVFILLSGFFLAFMPNETVAVAMLFLSFSLGFMLYKLVLKLIHWH